ncbi:TetR/AcrR family transcriptional regulator [Schleiferilactobacillus harbinensis]|jgi:AcrR family transcriptional regulator|uniref:TetR/AcrR family transcriptional regulator n=1 Tax=Schleiferilactobacillus harbinensis TaxID=304207 RepID=UPI00345ECEF7
MTKKDNRQKLINATDELLKDQSVFSITTKDITKAAGISVGVFYNYFDRKEDVFEEVVRHFFNYSMDQLKTLQREITGNNLRSELKFKEFLINGIDKNWENHFLNSDITLLSRKDEKFRQMMDSYNTQMVAVISEILQVIQPDIQEKPVTTAMIMMNFIQNSHPSFSQFESADEKEKYIDELVTIIYAVCFGKL